LKIEYTVILVTIN